MPIDTPHPDYTKNLPTWIRCRDVLEGEDAVKQAGVKYLPMLEGQESMDYVPYKERAMFYNASDRTAMGMVGAIMNKPATQELPPALAELEDMIGSEDQSLEQLTGQVLHEIVGMGRVGLLVDADEETGTPYIALYATENIVNWRLRKIEGVWRYELVVLKEVVLEYKDPFESEPITQYRVLQINSVGQYEVSVHRKEKRKDGREEWIEVSRVVPKMRGGITRPDIPFVTIGTTGITGFIEKPPLLNLINVNLSHYRTSADLEHGRHYTALPTAWVAGFDMRSNNLKVGSQVAWVSDDPNAKAGFLEFTGQGLGHLSQALKEKEQLMAVLGARLLEEQKASAEAAATVSMRHGGEKSILALIAGAATEGMTLSLQQVAEWLRAGGEVVYTLNQDYDFLPIDSAMLTALMLQVQGGFMSWPTYFHNVKRAGLVPEDRTEEDERELIEGSPVPGMTGTQVPGTEQEQEEEEVEEEEQPTRR